MKIKLPNDRRLKIYCKLDSKDIFEVGNEDEINMKNNNKRASDNRLSTIIPKPGAPSTRKKNTDQQRDSSVESNGSSRSPVRHNPYPNSAGQSSNNNNNIQNNIIDNDGNNNNNTRNNINNNNTQNNINDNDENNNNSNNAQINNKDYECLYQLKLLYF